MSWHNFSIQIQIMFHRVLHSDDVTMYSSFGLILLALIFMIAGATRYVEFLDFGFSKLRRSLLIFAHIAGCMALGLAFSLQGLDLDKKFSELGMGLLASALVLLFPIHIYIGLLRRIRNPTGIK